MSYTLMQACVDMRPPPGRELDARMFALLIVLCRHATDAGTDCFPGRELLQMETRLAERTLRVALPRLEKAGWVVVARTPGRRNSYSINVAAILAAQPREPERKLSTELSTTPGNSACGELSTAPGNSACTPPAILPVPPPANLPPEDINKEINKKTDIPTQNAPADEASGVGLLNSSPEAAQPAAEEPAKTQAEVCRCDPSSPEFMRIPDDTPPDIAAELRNLKATVLANPKRCFPPPPPPGPPPCPHDRILLAWDDLLSPPLDPAPARGARCDSVTEAFWTIICKKYDIREVDAGVYKVWDFFRDYIKRSPFLMGRAPNSRFKGSFYWCLGSERLQMILSGKYMPKNE